MASAVLLGLAATGLLVAGLALALVAHRLPFADRVVAAVERRPAVARAASRLRGGLAVAGRPRTMAGAIGWSVAAWAATIVAFAAAGQAIGVELTWGQAALLAAGVSLVTAIPAGPGLRRHVRARGGRDRRGGRASPRTPAFALALLVHAAILAVTSVGGVAAYLATRAGRGARLGGQTAPDGRPDRHGARTR